MKTIRTLGLGAVGTAVVLLLSVSHASAQPVGGAYYAGEVSGCSGPPCGSVDFRVSEDGSQVQAFTAYDVPGDVCEFVSYSYPVPLDIVDDSFGLGIPEMFEVSGSFLGEGNAEGTLRLAVDDPIPCDTGVLNWTAAVATPPVGGIAELPDISGSSARDYVAPAALTGAALVALATGAWYARRRWLS